MRIRSGFVSNSSSSSFVVFAQKKDIDKALSEIVDPKMRKWIREKFVSCGDKVNFEGKQYIRKVGIWTNEEMPRWEGEDFCEEDCFETARTFFNRIGPVSTIEGY